MQNFIKGYKNSPSTPRNSEQRKLLTFYKRTLAKKEEIVNYLLFGVLEKAYSRAAPGLSSPFAIEFKELETEMNRHEDFPYLEMRYGFEIKYILNLGKLDYRLINPLRNKLDWMNQHLVHLADYTSQVDQHLQSKIHAKPFFSSLISELEAIPVVRNRKVMFEEMEKLFNEKKWYALYALALPQVEGIFSEIINLLTKDKVKGSLTEKVNYLRAYYEHAHYTFDYYEFTLADLRNSFAHSGKINDPERKCYRLLLDISYLLKIFMEFDRL